MLLALAVAASRLLRRAQLRSALLAGSRVVIPFLSPPLIVIGGGALLAWATRELGYPARNPGGSVAVDPHRQLGHLRLRAARCGRAPGVGLLTLLAYLRGRADVRQLALGVSIPLFLVLLVAGSRWDPTRRGLLIPVALTGPLLARLLRGRLLRAAYLVVAATVLWATLVNDQGKPLHNPAGPPWDISRVQAIALAQPEDAPMLAAYDRLVPGDTCVGALLGANEPAYLLFGTRLQRQVLFLPPATTAASGGNDVTAAYGDGAPTS